MRAVGLLLVLAFVCLAAPAQARNVTGYIPVSGGAQLRYTASLPDTPGPFPVAMNYDGYCAGTGALTCNDVQMSKDLLDAGYAVLGVSIRGTGCSTGTFELRQPQEATDGATAVEWAAAQPWSDGHVGLFGDSFPALTQPGVAALHPKGLDAIVPFQLANDLYRDVAYPGGMSNYLFAVLWGVYDQPFNSAVGDLQNAHDDGRCAGQVAQNAVTSLPHNILLQGFQHPWDDAWWQTKTITDKAAKIDVPALGCVTWQDDEVSSRAAYTFFPRIDPKLLWFIGANGFHSQCEVNAPLIRDQVVAFFDHFLRGRANGFEKTARTQIWHEAHGAGTDNVPSWVTTYHHYPPRTYEARMKLGGAPQSYVGLPVGQPTENGAIFGQNGQFWKIPLGNATQWTTAPLTQDTELYGPASADLTIRSSVSDAALQVTVAEVRPDGQETYVQRGWLQASQQMLDTAATTAVDPVHTHREADSRGLVPGQDAHVRVGIYPFDHVFRAGSRIRLLVDPPSITGGWGLAPGRVPIGQTTITGGSLTVGVIPNGRAKKPLPACDTLRNQPCRPATDGGGTLTSPVVDCTRKVTLHLARSVRSVVLYVNGRRLRRVRGHVVRLTISSDTKVRLVEHTARRTVTRHRSLTACLT